MRAIRYYRNSAGEVATLEYAPAGLHTHQPRHIVKAHRTGRVCEWKADSVDEARKWWQLTVADLRVNGFVPMISN